MKPSGKPLVSVVMPSYNHARFIGEAVRSVLGQTFSELELIVVDNRSSDETDKVLGEFSDPRLKVIKFSNKGIIAASRNRGLAEASGEFAAFIDSDDVWLPRKLERQLSSISENAGNLLSYSRFCLLDGDRPGPEILPKAGRYYEGMAFSALYRRPFIACSGVLARRSAVEACGGFSESPELVAVEDMDLWLRMARKGPIVCAAEEPLFLYRVHAGAVSGGAWRTFRRTWRLARLHSGEAGAAAFAAKMIICASSLLRGKLAGWAK